jgi:hypothetical protein|tara:strand:+ start:812 stop:1144 length:333 start_codon:yes stop_codon:yes gene_type:complete
MGGNKIFLTSIMEEYNDYVVKKGTIQYKFISLLFLLCVVIFHPGTFDIIKEATNIDDTNVLLFIHTAVFSIVVYLMLVYSGDSHILSPCNIEIDMEDYLYYKKNVASSIS